MKSAMKSLIVFIQNQNLDANTFWKFLFSHYIWRTSALFHCYRKPIQFESVEQWNPEMFQRNCYFLFQENLQENFPLNFTVSKISLNISYVTKNFNKLGRLQVFSRWIRQFLINSEKLGLFRTKGVIKFLSLTSLNLIFR